VTSRDRLPESPWSVPITLDEVPETGRHVEFVADERVRTAVAKLAGLRALPRLSASFDVARRGRDGLHVAGQVSATVGQDCVVTLDPVDSEIEEPIDIVFSPNALAAATEVLKEDEDAEVSGEDGVEPLIGGTVDLGVLATEFLILGIDPYPRKPDAVFEPPPSADDGGHPFAALAALKKGKGPPA
jgi:Large ribosomal RNA subunit accumulation protein YceD